MRTAISEVSSLEIELAFRNWRVAEQLKSNAVDVISEVMDCELGDAVDFLNECRDSGQLFDRLGTEVYPEDCDFCEQEQDSESNLLGTIFGVGMFALAAVALVLGCVEVFGGN